MRDGPVVSGEDQKDEHRHERADMDGSFLHGRHSGGRHISTLLYEAKLSKRAVVAGLHEVRLKADTTPIQKPWNILHLARHPRLELNRHR
jgi:hypothetical protein